MTLTSSTFLTVSQLTSLLKEELEDAYRDLWVEGEISSMRVSPGGHYYFTLKDDSAQLRAVFFKGKAQFFKRHLKEGNKVVCHGDLSFYQERGEIQILVDFLEPRGKGKDFLLLELLKRRLASQGLFDAERKKPLPPLPSTIGIVTSPKGAAVRDIIKVIRELYPGVNLLLYPVTVQGERAPREISQALKDLNSLGQADVIILARGGGSKEDLAPFNTEEVARAVAASTLPVVSAVGHEIDTTLADLAADARAPTPSAAAQMVVAQALEMKGKLEHLQIRLLKAFSVPLALKKTHLGHLAQRLEASGPIRTLKDRRLGLASLEKELKTGMSRILDSRKERLLALSLRLKLQHPRKALEEKRHRLDTARTRLLQGFQAITNSKKGTLSPLARALESLSPLAILERGYSITLTPGGHPVTSTQQVETGSQVKIILHQGALVAKVEEKIENN